MTEKSKYAPIHREFLGYYILELGGSCYRSPWSNVLEIPQIHGHAQILETAKPTE